MRYGSSPYLLVFHEVLHQVSQHVFCVVELTFFFGGYAETVIRHNLESSKCVLRAILFLFQSLIGIWVS